MSPFGSLDLLACAGNSRLLLAACPSHARSTPQRAVAQMARSKKACIIFFDEIDAIGGARFDDGAGGDNEVQRTMLEIVNQLDGFDARGNIKVLMATNRPDTLDPALLRPGRLDRKVEFGLPDLEARTQIFKIHTKCVRCYISPPWCSRRRRRYCPHCRAAVRVLCRASDLARMHHGGAAMCSHAHALHKPCIRGRGHAHTAVCHDWVSCTVAHLTGGIIQRTLPLPQMQHRLRRRAER
jgi:ATPase family associated with various cellular activities (AAA)